MSILPFPRALSAKTLRSIGVLATAGAFVCGQLMPQAALAGPSRTALLGLDAADSNVGREVSDALADSLEARNALFRAPLTFAEYRLMMSCSPENNRCLGRAGEGFDAPQIMLGNMVHSGDEVQVNLRLIRNRSGILLAKERFTFKPKHLQGADLMTSADYMVNTLFAMAAKQDKPVFPFAPIISSSSAKSSQVAQPNPTSASPTQREQEPAQPKQPVLKTPPPNREVLGNQTNDRPPATSDPSRRRAGLGNKVGLGVSLGLAAASFGAAFVIQHRLRKRGPIHQELLDAAAASISETDNDPNNDVHPTRPDNLCDIARIPRPTDSSKVRNPDMAAICNKGERMVLMNNSLLIAGGVFTATAAVFLGLVIRDSRAKQRRLSMSGSWAPGYGSQISGRWRF